MIKIIRKSQFVVKPWKNGLGETLELAFNSGETADSFDWRLSIASVNQDGYFSDFPNVDRNLYLLKGNGIYLKHQLGDICLEDTLRQPLQCSTFNGASTTYGELIDGPIKAFNVMTKKDKYKVDVKNYPTHFECSSVEESSNRAIYADKSLNKVTLSLTEKDIMFIYFTHEGSELGENTAEPNSLHSIQVKGENKDVKSGDLILLAQAGSFTLMSKNCLIITLTQHELVQ